MATILEDGLHTATLEVKRCKSCVYFTRVGDTYGGCEKLTLTNEYDGPENDVVIEAFISGIWDFTVNQNFGCLYFQEI